MSAWSSRALSYFVDHGIDPDVSRALGVTEENGELRFPYRDNYANPYVRRRPLDGNRTFQPRGKKLVPWMPCPDDGVYLICEGESDLMASASVIYEAVEDEQGGVTLDRRRGLPPVLEGVVPIAIPGAGSAHEGVAVLLAEEVADAWIVLDGDAAGRKGAVKLKERSPPPRRRARPPWWGSPTGSTSLTAWPRLSRLPAPSGSRTSWPTPRPAARRPRWRGCPPPTTAQPRNRPRASLRSPIPRRHG